MKDVTQILSRLEQGDCSASDQLLPRVYGELRRLAAAKMAQEAPYHTLQASSLVHEAYLRLLDDDQVRNWDSRGHFFKAAAEAMRWILVESARRKQGPQRGGDRQRVDAELDEFAGHQQSPDLLALSESLDDLANALMQDRPYAADRPEQHAGGTAASSIDSQAYADHGWPSSECQ